MLYLPSPDPAVPAVFDDAVRESVGTRHDLSFFDHKAPLDSQFEGVDVVIDLGGSVGTRQMVDAADCIRLWQVLGTGVDHFDLGYWRSRGVPVANCPGALSAVALAECAMMFILMLSRRYGEARTAAEARHWYSVFGSELKSRTLGLVGFGASAKELAARAKSFDMSILAVDLKDVPAKDQAHYGLAWCGHSDALDEMLPRVDFLSLHLPLNHVTRHILNSRRIALLAPTAHVINVARGALVDEDAMLDALQEGRLAGAGLDVFAQEPPSVDSPLLKHPNVIVTPHIAGATNGTARRRAQLAAENCDRVAEGLEPLHRVV